MKERLLCHDVWLQNKTYLPSTDIRNILVRSNSEAPVIDVPKKLGRPVPGLKMGEENRILVRLMIQRTERHASTQNF